MATWSFRFKLWTIKINEYVCIVPRLLSNFVGLIDKTIKMHTTWSNCFNWVSGWWFNSWDSFINKQIRIYIQSFETIDNFFVRKSKPRSPLSPLSPGKPGGPAFITHDKPFTPFGPGSPRMKKMYYSFSDGNKSTIKIYSMLSRHTKSFTVWNHCFEQMIHIWECYPFTDFETSGKLFYSHNFEQRSIKKNEQKYYFS